MEDTLESIKPVMGNRTMDSNLSFIYGRDPSILAYGQQPFPQEVTKKDLDYLYEDEEPDSRSYVSSVPSISALGDTIKVYLRMRPFPRKMKLTQQQQEAYKIMNANTLLTKLPSLDNNCSTLKRLKPNDTVSRKFTFTNTFGPDTTQLQLFDQAVKEQMNQFLNGRSATVMSYGTTNAGKSYTLQGTTASPGIIPRGLEFVFCNINPRATPCYKPLYNTDVVSLDANARAYEMELKTKLLSFGSIDKNQYIQAYRSMQQLLQDESPLKPSEASDASYSVWVSFAEIYNETIFDLLSNDCQKKRPSLKLATDSNGKAFIRDLKMVCVNSGSEAYQLLMAGQYNLKVAATALNARSSRSHCIFTIKLLKYYKENSPNDVEVSTFSFCDLAGSERLKKTLNAGERLKEAQNINTSLLVLGRCLKSIFNMQSMKSKQEVIGPFRESKLTRLFQSALSGKEHIALIVNVNPVPNLYIETQNVLNFSAIAKQIVIEPVVRKKTASRSRFSQMVSQSVTTVTDWDVTDLESIGKIQFKKNSPVILDTELTKGEEVTSRSMQRTEYIHLEDYEEVLQENEKLKKEVAQLKNSALNTDFAIRQEMSNIYTAMMKDLEANYKNRLQDVEEQQADMLEWSVKQVENYYKEKLSMVSNRKRSRMDSGDDSEDEMNAEELEAENIQLTAKVESLKKSVKELRESNEQLLVEKNHNVFELSLVKKDLKNCKDLLHAVQNDINCGEEAKIVIEELRKQLSAREDQIKSLKTYLNEAKEEFIRITQVEKELEESLKKKDEQLLECSEKITDLTEQLEEANICLAESTKTIENYEDKIEIYSKKLTTAEENLQNAEDKLSKSGANYLVIRKENEELKKRIDQSDKITSDKCDCDEKNLQLEELRKELSGVKISSKELEEKIVVKNEIIDTLNSNILDHENENSSLKRSLAQSKEDTKILRDELDSTKSMISDITEQIKILQMAEAAKPMTLDADCQTEFVNDGELLGNENLVVVKQEIINNEEEVSAENNNNENSNDEISMKEINSVNNNEGKNYEEDNEKLIEQLTVENNDLNTRIEALDKELDEAKQELASVKASLTVNEQRSMVYKDLVKSVEDQLQICETDVEKVTQELNSNKRDKEILENKIIESNKIVDKLQTELEESRNKNKKNIEALEDNSEKIKSLENQLSEEIEKSKEISAKRLAEHEIQMNKLEKEISSAKERDLIKEQLLDAHIQRIGKLEKDISEAEGLEEKLKALENDLEKCENEKMELKKLLDDNSSKILSLENELQAALVREQDKENETISLQKEMKIMIQTTTNESKKDIEMEKEVKKTLRELTATKKELEDKEADFKMRKQKSEEKILRLEMRLKTFEENASYLALLKEGAEKKQAETEQLRIINNELRREIQQKTQELVSFNKNRDDTIQRYESLVKQLQEDLDRSKREISRYQELFLRQSTPTPRKEEIRKLKDELRSKTSLLEQVQEKLKKSESMREEKENINSSEDETNSVIAARKTRRRGKNNPPSAAHDISVIELSGSESKRVTRRTALPPPSTVPSVEKRTTRKKKLFALADEVGCVDIEPPESTPRPILRSPLSATRSLRNRRK